MSNFWRPFNQVDFWIKNVNFSLREFPDKQKCIPQILIWCPTIQINICMHDFCDLVCKDHDVLLKDFSHLSKPSNVTKSKYVYVLLSWNQRIEVLISFVDVWSNDLCSCFSKAKSQEFSYFSQTLLKYFSLKFWSFLFRFHEL